MSSEEKPSLKNMFLQRSAQRIQRTKINTTPVIQIKKGNPFFTKNDIFKTNNPIARLCRFIFVDKQITDIELYEAHDRNGRALQKIPRDINTDKGNLKKALEKPRMTVGQLEKILTILGFQIVDLAYTLKNPTTGEVSTYSLSKISDFLEESHQDSWNGIIVSSEEDGGDVHDKKIPNPPLDDI